MLLHRTPFRPRWTELKVRRTLYRTDPTASTATLGASGEHDADGPSRARAASPAGPPRRARAPRAAGDRDLDRRRCRPRRDRSPRRRLVRDDRRAPLRAAGDQRRPPALAAAAHARTADPEREPALPAGDRGG